MLTAEEEAEEEGRGGEGVEGEQHQVITQLGLFR